MKYIVLIIIGAISAIVGRIILNKILYISKRK